MISVLMRTMVIVSSKHARNLNDWSQAVRLETETSCIIANIHRWNDVIKLLMAIIYIQFAIILIAIIYGIIIKLILFKDLQMV